MKFLISSSDKMHSSLQNQVNEKTVHAMGYLEPIVKKMHINLKNTKERVDADKEELRDLKKEFSKIFSELVKKRKIHNILIPNIGYVHNQKIAEDTPVNTMITIYNNLEAFYLSTSGKASSFVVQEKKQAIVRVLEEEQEAVVVAHSSEKKKTGLWETLAETLGISNLSEKNYMDILKKFNGKQYTTQQLIKIIEDLKHIKKKHGYSLDEKGRDFMVELNKNIKEFLEISQEKIREESKKKSKEISEKIFFNNIGCFDIFVNWAKSNLENKSFTKFISLEALKINKQEYTDFLEFRKEFTTQYQNEVFQKYELLFSQDPTLDTYYYNSMIGNIKRLGEIYSLKMSDQQFFLGAKRGFLLGDIYEFLGNYLEEIKKSEVLLSPLLQGELFIYGDKNPLKIYY